MHLLLWGEVEKFVYVENVHNKKFKQQHCNRELL